jgi:hypothetical protein
MTHLDADLAAERRSERSTDDLHCITQDPEEPTPPEFLAVCDDNPVDVMTSRYCAGHNCGGHPICAPCLDLARQTGLVV